ncbi:LOG family protein [Thioalkalicoccus limnaeus]|uniref:AMP nucleosidase n=1 Tax=Thioalkalicoccus limnaeus TaxID=120681 RepID=A0ABV4BH79_9GAMM
MSEPRDPRTVSLADEEGVKRILIDTLFGLWSLVNNLTRLRPSKRERYRVTIFGSARTQPGHWVYDEVKRLAAELAALDCDIVTGGGPGLMQAANEGARSSAAGERAQSVGIRVDLPFEQEVNPFVQEAYEHQTFFTRLHHFVLLSDAYIVVPGGIGTVLETMLVWQLLQVRHLRDTPLILTGKMWSELVDWAARYMLRPGFELANPEDMAIPRCVTGADEAIAIVREHHARWLQSQTQQRIGDSPSCQEDRPS